MATGFAWKIGSGATLLFGTTGVGRVLPAPASGTATGTISTITRVEPGELVAPVGIWFEATGISGFAVSEPTGDDIYDPTAHDITYIWDFDDPGSFTAPLNIPTAWNNKNVDYGKKVYHVFDTPGTYSVSVWGIGRDGTIGEQTVSIVVQDPDTLYSGTRTICYSASGTYTDKPDGAQEATSLADAQSRYRALGQTGRLLLRREETYQETYEISGQSNHRFGAFGTGAKPVVKPPIPAGGSTGWGSVFGFQNQNTVADSAFYDLDFQGDWDATKETGDPRASAIGIGTHNNVDWNILVYRCDFDGINGLAAGHGEVEAWLYAIVDCHMVNARDYMIGQFGGDNVLGAKMAVVGSSLHDPEDACRGGYGVEGLGNVYGSLRSGSTRNIILSACDFYNASAPSGGNDVQPTLRLGQNGGAPPAGWHMFLNANRLVVEGGDSPLNFRPMSPESPELPANAIFDMCLFMGDYNLRDVVGIGHGGVTMRNTIMTSLANSTTGSGIGFVNLNQDNPREGVAAMPVHVYNCTFYSVQSSEIPLTANAAGRTALTVENNVNHQPNASVTSNAPVDLTQTITGVRPRNRGRRVGPQKVSTSVSGVGNGGTFTIGYPSGTGPADFSAGGRHTVKIGSAWWFSYRGDCSLSFGASNITVTNLSDTTMTGTAELGLDQDTLATPNTYASPTTIPLPRLGADSSALAAGNTGLAAATDFATAFRPVTNETSETPSGTAWPTGDVHGGAVQETA